MFALGSAFYHPLRNHGIGRTSFSPILPLFGSSLIQGLLHASRFDHLPLILLLPLSKAVRASNLPVCLTSRSLWDYLLPVTSVWWEMAGVWALKEVSSKTWQHSLLALAYPFIWSVCAYMHACLCVYAWMHVCRSASMHLICVCACMYLSACECVCIYVGVHVCEHFKEAANGWRKDPGRMGHFLNQYLKFL